MTNSSVPKTWQIIAFIFARPIAIVSSLAILIVTLTMISHLVSSAIVTLMSPI